jgi:hypothetical protein
MITEMTALRAQTEAALKAKDKAENRADIRYQSNKELVARMFELATRMSTHSAELEKTMREITDIMQRLHQDYHYGYWEFSKELNRYVLKPQEPEYYI